MASNIRVNSKKISDMGRAGSFGVMGGSTRVAGTVESKAASATTLTSTASSEKATGSMEDANAGWTMREKKSERAIRVTSMSSPTHPRETISSFLSAKDL